MKQVDLPAPGGGARVHRVLVFGSGILGGAIERCLSASASGPATDIRWPWDDADGRRAVADRICALVQADSPAAISLVWAAGRSGMGSSADDMRRETNLVAEISALAIRLRADATPVHVHLISSAGGLFDGCTHVDQETQPAPARPYGLGKFAQEQDLARAAAANGLFAHVYRPTTVYGFQAGARMGLIPVLILNGLAGRTSTIIGRADTIRDYIATQDVARFIAGRIRRLAPPAPQPMLLASGRPAPLAEIVSETEHLLGTKLYLRYDPRPSNSANMSFRPSAIPPDLQPVDIRSGIRRVAEAVRTHAFSPAHG